MYQVIEYNDYRKENHIKLHGVTSDLEKAKQRVKEILEKMIGTHDEKDSFYQVYELPKNYCNDYVYLAGGKNVMCQYSYRFIEFSKLLGKTIRELYEVLDEKVPKTLSPDEVITKDVFYELIQSKKLDHYLTWLREDIGDICIDTYSTIVAVVKCDEF